MSANQALAQTPQDQKKSLENWKIALTGTAFPTSNTHLNLTLQEKEKELQNTILPKINTSPDTPYLFSNIKDWKTNTTQITITSTNIEKMALLYQTPNSKYYHNPALQQQILFALDWFYKNMYNEKTTNTYGGWYDWQIGTPITLVNTLTLMKENTDKYLFQNILNTINHALPTTISDKSIGTGANRINKGFTLLMSGVLGNNQANIDLGTEIIKRVYMPVQSGDGFYSDGTFIQHSNTPYTSGYGAEVIARSADIYQLFAGTQTMSSQRSLPSIFTYLDTTYLPVLYKNEVLDMTRGRGISLKAISNEQIANTLIYDMLIVSQKNKDVAYRAKFATRLKASIAQSATSPDFYKKLTLPQAQHFQNLLQNTSISAQYPSQTHNKMMPYASQMIDTKPTYVAALSMFSKRISAFESIGGQNLLGFYTGTGALSIYNGDAALKSNYYPTVDMTSLPGTTTDHKTKSITADNLKYLNPYSWSGGISDQTFGSATMQYSLKNVTGSSLMARKSWFFLNGKIVALGSGISSQENLNTETIVENRQLIHPTNAFSVSGTTLSTGQTKTLSNVKWAYLNGSTQNESMGYVFPAATTVTSYKRVQSGDWKTLNTRNSPSPVSATYAGLRIPHGKAPQNKSYSYILLPGKSKQATEAYSKKMDVEIRANNLNQQAVFDKSQNLWIGNFLQPSSLNGYSAKTRGSMMVKKASGSEKIVISDPSMEQSKVTFLVPQQTGFKLKRKSPEITYSTQGKNWLIQVNTSAKNGASFTILFGK